MENQLQRYANVQDGRFMMKTAGRKPFLDVQDFSFNFQMGDLAVVYAKTMGNFNVSYQFVKPITKPSEAAHDLLSADRFIHGFVIPVIKWFDGLLNADSFDEEELQEFVNEFSLSNVQVSYTGGKTPNFSMVVSGNF